MTDLNNLLQYDGRHTRILAKVTYPMEIYGSLLRDLQVPPVRRLIPLKTILSCVHRFSGRRGRISVPFHQSSPRFGRLGSAVSQAREPWHRRLIAPRAQDLVL